MSGAADEPTSPSVRAPARGRVTARRIGVAAALGPLLLLSPAAAGAAVEAVATVATTPPATAPAGVGGVSTAPGTTSDPLDVSIDAVSPAAVPRRGPLTIRGTVTNDSIDTWSGVQVYGVPSPGPMTTAAELAEAAATPADTFLGERITDEFAEVGDLPPGTTRAFQLRLPRDLLPDAGEGVYWMGVQALGANDDGRDEIADGRARTFLPRVDGDDRSVEAALVLPLRHPVRRDEYGRVANLASWADALSPGGRLDRVLDFGAEAAATDAEVTWLLDPAVADTVGEVVGGNAGLSIDPTTGPVPGEDPDADPDADPGTGDGADDGADDGAGESPDGDASGGGAGEDGEEDGGGDPTSSPDPDEDAAEDDDRPTATRAPALGEEEAALEQRTATQGADWLQQLRGVLDASAVLALPYGDVDVDAVARAGGGLLADARTRSDEVTRQQGLEDALPVVAPPNGLVDPSTIPAVPEGETVLLSDAALAIDDPGTVTRVDGRNLVVSSSAAATGGPDPDDPLSPLAVRQRLVAEAAVRLLEAGPDDASLVVTAPTTWSPQPGTGFFRELDRLDWFALSGLEDVADGTGPTLTEQDAGTQADLESGRDQDEAPGLEADAVRYPETAQAREVPGEAVVDAQQALDGAATLQDVLPLNTDVGQQVLDQVLPGLAYANRGAPQRARRAVALPGTQVGSLLGEIAVEAPTSLTLSSASGDFSVQLKNGLDQPVLVRLRARTDADLEVSAPAEVEVPPGSGATVPMTVSGARPGISNVEIEVTDSEGRPVGAVDAMPVRSAQIGDVIWLVLGVGATLLFGTIALRLLRRVVAARRAAG